MAKDPAPAAAAAPPPPPASSVAAASTPHLLRAVTYLVKAIEADHLHRPMSPEVAAALREAKSALGG